MEDVKWSVINWRGSAGVISPNLRVGAQDLAAALPDGIGVIARFLDAREGTPKEFVDALPELERNVEELAGCGVDVIAQNGAPPMIVHGYQAERELVAKWEAAYGIPVVTSVAAQVEAMRALGMRKIVGLTYLSDEMNDFASAYFTAAGFDVLAMDGIGTFTKAHHIPAVQIYAFAKALYLRHEEADGIYLLGAGWHVAGAVEPLEQDLEVPVVGGRGPESWALQRRLRVRQPKDGYGRILSEFPRLQT